MDAVGTWGPLFALVDDDALSARLMIRTLGEAGVSDWHIRCKWIGGTRRAKNTLHDLWSVGRPPQAMLVNLKPLPDAATFITEIAKAAKTNGTLVFAMAPSLEREVRTALIDAGATAVFERGMDQSICRNEADSLIDLWLRMRPVGLQAAQ